MSREERIRTLEEAGIDVSGIQAFQVNQAHSNYEIFGREVDEVDDEILEQILEDGYVRNTKLHRRWIMAQMFRMLNYKDSNGKRGYQAALNRIPFDYQFKMMLEELRVLSKIELKDIDTFIERKKFFSPDAVIAICTEYMETLRKHVKELKTHRCKGVSYKKIGGKNVFITDISAKVYMPLEMKLLEMKKTNDYQALYKVFSDFYKRRIKLPQKTEKSKTWEKAYKGEGAYYTLKNMVMYHNCFICDESGNEYVGTDAVDYINSFLDTYSAEGWRYMAMLKKCIIDNDFDFVKRMQDLREE